MLIFSLVISSPNTAPAQHEIDPETWIEMRKMFRNKGPTPTIDEDIAALAGPEAKRAGPRLIDRGPEALPAVYAAISLEAPGLVLRQGSNGVILRRNLLCLQGVTL